MSEDAVIWTARTAPGRLPGEAGGSFASRADVMQWLGWSLDVIAARERDASRKREFGDWRGKQRAAGLSHFHGRDFGFGETGLSPLHGRGRDAGWERFRTWGRSLIQALERNRLTARISYYVFRAQVNAGMEAFGGAWEDFQALFERAAFVVGGVLNRGKTFMWKLRNEVCEFVQNLWKRERKQRGWNERNGRNESRIETGSRDTRGRVDNTKISKGFLNFAGEDFGATDVAAAQAPSSKGTNVEAGETLKAAGSSEHGGFSLSNSGAGIAGGVSDLGRQDCLPSTGGVSEGGDRKVVSPLAKFRGRFKGRGMYIVLHAAFDCHVAGGHWDGDELFSGAHVTSWLKACFAAGKDMAEAVKLYGAEIERMRGKGYVGKRWIPMLFAGLYEKAAGLPEWKFKN